MEPTIKHAQQLVAERLQLQAQALANGMCKAETIEELVETMCFDLQVYMGQEMFGNPKKFVRNTQTSSPKSAGCSTTTKIA